MDDIIKEKIADAITLDEMRDALDGLDTMVFVADLVSNKILFMSAGCEKIYGAPAQAFYDDPNLWLTFFPPEELPSVQKEMQEWSNGKPSASVRRIIRADGVERWVETRTLPVLDGAGTLIRVTGFATDVTEQKLSTEAAISNANHYQSLFDNMLEGFASCEMVYDGNGKPVDFRYLEVNSMLETLTGLKNVTGKLVTEIIPGIREANPEMFEIYERVASTGKPEKFETYIDPLKLWLSISVYSVTKGFFTAVFDNITDRKAAEEALRSSEQELSLAVGLANIAPWKYDPRQNIFIFGKEFYALYGTTVEEEGLTMTPEVFSKKFVYPDDQMIVGEEIGKALKSVEREYAVSLETRVVRKDGSIRINTVSFKVLRDAAGNIVDWYGVNQDITERKRQETRIKELNDLRMKFIQIVSHQLRTPLGSIRWNLELLMDGSMGALTDVQKQFLHVTYNADVEVLERINDLLIVIDIEEKRIAFMKENISIESLLSSVVGEMKPRCTAKELTCNFHLPETPLDPLFVDPQKMRQVFVKLIENAITYTPEKGSIEGTLTKVGSMIRFELTDTGIGIPAAEQKMFSLVFFVRPMHFWQSLIRRVSAFLLQNILWSSMAGRSDLFLRKTREARFGSKCRSSVNDRFGVKSKTRTHCAGFLVYLLYHDR